MADPSKVQTYNPTVGKVEAVDPSKLARQAEADGSRELSAVDVARYEAQQRREAREGDYVQGRIAETVGKVRGVGEAFGVPTDEVAGGVADLFGKGIETRGYLRGLNEDHPFMSGAGELAGQVGGSIGVGALTGGGGTAGGVAKRFGGYALRGGLENLVIGSTHDVNEGSLGNPDLAGEKLLAQMPKHLVLGAVGGVVGGAIGEGIGAAWNAFSKSAPKALESGADRLIGREFGGDAALGAEIRSKVGKVPGSAEEVVSTLQREQQGFQAASLARTASEREALAARQVGEAGKLSAEQEARRLATAKESKRALEELASQHQAAREALTEQAAQATKQATELAAEREAARLQLRSLAGKLDAVPGAELPNARTILDSAKATFGGTLAPSSPNAQKLFQEWTQAFEERAAKGLSFKELQSSIKSLDQMEVRQRVVSGWGNDPEVAKAFQSLRQAARDEFDRASEATAAMAGDSTSLSAKGLRDRIPELDKAYKEALAGVDQTEAATLAFERAARKEAALAEREAAQGTRKLEAGIREEDRAFDRASRAEEKALPKASKETPVDTLLGRIKAPAKAEASPAGVALGLGGAALSLAHGNAAGAAMGALSALQATGARSGNNLTAARTMRALADLLSKSDGEIARVAGRAVGRYVRQGSDTDLPKSSKREVTFEKAAKEVRSAAANPLMLESRVREAAGPWAKDAPGVYSALLTAAQRQQAFLASKLPQSRVDPLSPTAHLEPDDLSDTEKYDFLQYFKASKDPVKAMEDVAAGKGTPQQVEAVEAVYPQMYEQTKNELRRYLASLTKPLDYDYAVNIGTLMQVDTDTVMTGGFQSALADMYSEREKSEEMPGGSKPRGVNSRLSKSMQSAGQSMQGDD